jgi:hypothetical protein
MLSRRDPPPTGTAMKPRRTAAELLYADATWRPATVLGWYRLDVARRQPVTNRWIFWLVRLRLAGREEAWFEYDNLNLRPVKASSRSASGK